MKIGIFAGIFFLVIACVGYADFATISSFDCIEPHIIAYKQCVDERCGTGYIMPEGCSDPCKTQLEAEQAAYEECTEESEVCLKNTCQVKVLSDFDGVSADNVSSINFTIEVAGNYEDFYLYLKPKDGQTIRGKVEQVTDTVISFTPAVAGIDRNYLSPQEVQAVGWCVPKQASCETELPDKLYSTKDFVIVQPPLFFVHGIWSSAEVWAKFKNRAGMDGWWYGDISYESTDDNKYNAKLLSDEIGRFIKKVNSGELYEGKKISAKKVDIVAHSMGGLVTRYYIGSYMYKNDIRKFLMLGTPNNGQVDLNILSKIFRDPFGNQMWTTVEQLRPGDQFILDLNKQELNPKIEYHTIAGTGWHTYTFSDNPPTWRGDGVVLVDSVRLPNVPIYCTYDTHAAGVRWVRLLFSANPLIALRGFDTKDDITITESEVAYGVAKNALLSGGSISPVDCNEDLYTKPGYHPIAQMIAWLQSPATLHAYDEEGNHIGLDDNGNFENTIGEGAYYISNSSVVEGQVIRIIGGKKARFVIKGYESGEIGFNFVGLSENGSITEKIFENIAIDARTQYTFDALGGNLELVKEELPKKGYSLYAYLAAAAAVIFGAVLLAMRKLKKK